MYLPKIQFLDGIFSAWRCEHTRPGRARATPPTTTARGRLVQLVHGGEACDVTPVTSLHAVTSKSC